MLIVSKKHKSITKTMATWELKYGSQFTKQTKVKYELMWLLKYE